MTYQEAKKQPVARLSGLTTDPIKWLQPKLAQNSLIAQNHKALYLAGSIVWMYATGSNTFIHRMSMVPDVELTYPIRFSSHAIKVARIRRTLKGKKAILRKLGFTDTEIGTAMLLNRMGVDPA